MKTYDLLRSDSTATAVDSSSRLPTTLLTVSHDRIYIFDLLRHRSCQEDISEGRPSAIRTSRSPSTRFCIRSWNSHLFGLRFRVVADRSVIYRGRTPAGIYAEIIILPHPIPSAFSNGPWIPVSTSYRKHRALRPIPVLASRTFPPHPRIPRLSLPPHPYSPPTTDPLKVPRPHAVRATLPTLGNKKMRFSL